MRDIDSKKALLRDRETLKQRAFLRKLYTDFYNELFTSDIPKGLLVELGSGGGFIKDIMPRVTTSDIIKGPEIDKVFSATRIPFASKSVAAFVMVDVLHHIKDVEKAFSEMQRCLKKGGKI